MSDNGGLTPTGFGELLESALRNVLVQLETLDTRVTKNEEFIRNEIKNKAIAGRIIHDT